MGCTHKRGEFSDDYQHCLDCGREVMLINGVWFEIEGWLRVSTALLGDDPSAQIEQQRQNNAD